MRLSISQMHGVSSCIIICMFFKGTNNDYRFSNLDRKIYGQEVENSSNDRKRNIILISCSSIFQLNISRGTTMCKKTE